MQYGMEIRDVVPTIVDAMLPRFSDEYTGLFMTIEVKATRYSDRGPDISFYRSIEFCFQRPHNYTKVFAAVSDNVRDRTEDKDFEFITDHDSCWRDGVGRVAEGVFNELRVYFAERDVDMKDIHSHISFSIFGGTPHFRKIMIKPDPNDDRGYMKTLTVCQKVETRNG